MTLPLLRVEVGDKKLPSLELADNSLPSQGSRVLAFGNPLGMRDSVVTGIVSAIQNIEGRKMIQLAMPIQPGNSGGPLVDSQGKVIGIINMKSAIDDNLGFAIPINQLDTLLVSHQTPSRTRGGFISVTLSERGLASHFRCHLDPTWWHDHGSRRGLRLWWPRTLPCQVLKRQNGPFEIAVRVRMDKESGAAGHRISFGWRRTGIMVFTPVMGSSG